MSSLTLPEAPCGTGQVFRTQRSELYWLALLITGDRERSIASYGRAQNLAPANGVFRGFLLDWARRLVIVESLAAVRAQIQEWRPPDEMPILNPCPPSVNREGLEWALLHMEVLPRCAVILMLMERIPMAEAATLLRVQEATAQAALRAGVVELTRLLQRKAEQE